MLEDDINILVYVLKVLFYILNILNIFILYFLIIVNRWLRQPKNKESKLNGKTHYSTWFDTSTLEIFNFLPPAS